MCIPKRRKRREHPSYNCDPHSIVRSDVERIRPRRDKALYTGLYLLADHQLGGFWMVADCRNGPMGEMERKGMTEPTELQKAIDDPLPMKSAKEWVKSLGNREARHLFANSPALMLDFIETVQKDAINSTDNHAKQLAAELEKWKEGCLVNGNNAKDALRKSDERRLEILSIKAELKMCAEALNEPHHDQCFCHFQGTCTACLQIARKKQALAQPITQSLLKPPTT